MIITIMLTVLSFKWIVLVKKSIPITAYMAKKSIPNITIYTCRQYLASFTGLPYFLFFGLC